jgi:hypothetical protein
MPLVSNIITEQAGPDALWNDPTPVQDVVSEKPWHRVAIMLAAQGCTVTEIAEKMERTVAWVSLLLRQPWARERITSEIMEGGRDEIETLIKGAAPEAFRRIISLSENAEAEAVKLAANREIIDRLLGKPVQKVEQKNTNLNLDMGKIDEELKKLEDEEKRLLGSRVAPGSPGRDSTLPAESPAADDLSGNANPESLSA